MPCRPRPAYGRVRLAAVAVVLALGAAPAVAGEARVAVAANFLLVAEAMAADFAGEHRVTLSSGATGALYAQIRQGAPFDVFLAADRERPALALAEGLAVAGSDFTYATGALVLYSAEAGRVRGAETLAGDDFTRIALANPATAPYGQAALAVLRNLGRLDALRPRLVFGNSIAQAYQFVATGNAELGFVAASQVITEEGGSRWPVPADLHPLIAQDAVLLRRGADNAAAVAFLDYLASARAHAISARFGYGPGERRP